MCIGSACQFGRNSGDATVAIVEETLYQRHASPSGMWELILTAEPGWAFAPHTITVLRRATAREPGRGQPIFTFELANDGANLRDDNCTVAWQQLTDHEIATLTCTGQEQEPAVYAIDITDGQLLRGQ
ncbi:MAG: hypothetical protein R2867_07075 [Caldilineaceae bacterium]